MGIFDDLDPLLRQNCSVMFSDSCGCREEWLGEVTPTDARLSVQLGEDTLTIEAQSADQLRVLGPALASLRFRPAPATEETRRVLQEELGNCDQLLELGEGGVIRAANDSLV